MLFLIFLAVSALAEEHVLVSKGAPLPLILPNAENHGFALQESTLSIFNSFKTKFALVTVIGPYRSGKSFLLNQLMGVPCNIGFGVGHKREANTKGIWIWSEPVLLRASNGEETAVFFVDTEGLQSGENVDAYDDRIFAFATMVSSVLIYNLPETVKAGDLEKLSFAVTLADEFQDERADTQTQTQTQTHNAFMPCLFWLIQRDFLETSLAEAVAKVLKPVENAGKDPHVERLNRIRSSLGVFECQVVFGLKQPHIERTKLCELSDSVLDQTYIEQRSDLRRKVLHNATPKRLGGEFLLANNLPTFLRNLVSALNSREIPSAVDVVDVFNRRFHDECLNIYVKDLDSLSLPVSVTDLERAHVTAKAAAVELFISKRFGKSSSLADSDFSPIFEKKEMENRYESLKICEHFSNLCLNEVDAATMSVLPSMKRVLDTYTRCQSVFESRCVGPSNTTFDSRLSQNWERKLATAELEYNSKLSASVALLSLATLFVARFIFAKPLLELIAGAGVFFIGVAPRVLGDSVYQNIFWKNFAAVYEEVVYNNLFDLNAHIEIWVPLVGMAIVAAYTFRKMQARRRRRRDRDF